MGKSTLDSGKTIDDIIKLLKSGDAKGVQEALGMTADAKLLYKKADGMFGLLSLENLKAGKLVLPSKTVSTGTTYVASEIKTTIDKETWTNTTIQKTINSYLDSQDIK